MHIVITRVLTLLLHLIIIYTKVVINNVNEVAHMAIYVISFIILTMLAFFIYLRIRLIFRKYNRRKVVSELVMSKQASLSEEEKKAWDDVIYKYRMKAPLKNILIKKRIWDVRWYIMESDLPNSVKELEIKRFDKYYAGLKTHTLELEKPKEVEKTDKVDDLIRKVVEDNDVEVVYVDDMEG